jgi:hypothetical protein
MKTGLRVRDGDDDKCSGKSTTCINLTAASVVADGADSDH